MALIQTGCLGSFIPNKSLLRVGVFFFFAGCYHIPRRFIPCSHSEVILQLLDIARAQNINREHKVKCNLFD